MAFGKGTWEKQDKKLPGTYINFVGEEQLVDTFGARGKAAMALSFDWGEDTDEIFVLTPGQFKANSRQLFGYDYLDAKLQPIYEVFLGGARELYLYRLNASGGAKASSAIGKAKYAGTRGNDLSVVITANVDQPSLFDVVTYLGGIKVDKQVAVDSETLADNDFIVFNESPELSATTVTFSSGTNGTAAKKANHIAFLTKLEAYQVNCVGLFEAAASDGDVTSIYANWAIVQRDTYANPIQAVLYNSPSDNEAVINVDDSLNLVPWFLGAEAGCEINKTIQNKVYNGKYAPAKVYSQSALELAIDEGKLVLQVVGSQYRVLADVNSLVTIPVDKNPEFKYNQTIRVMDQIAIDVSNIFNNGYIGKVANNDAGRLSFKNQVVILLNEYVNRSVINEYDTGEVTCVEGEQRGALVLTMPVTLVNMLEKAYITVVVG